MSKTSRIHLVDLLPSKSVLNEGIFDIFKKKEPSAKAKKYYDIFSAAIDTFNAPTIHFETRNREEKEYSDWSNVIIKPVEHGALMSCIWDIPGKLIVSVCFAFMEGKKPIKFDALPESGNVTVGIIWEIERKKATLYGGFEYPFVKNEVIESSKEVDITDEKTIQSIAVELYKQGIEAMSKKVVEPNADGDRMRFKGYFTKSGELINHIEPERKSYFWIQKLSLK